MPDLHLLVLAAGRGTRMKSARPKVLHQVAGIPLIDHVIDVGRALRPQSVTVVVGHQAGALETHLLSQKRLKLVVQEPQLGTAHAVLAAERVLRRAKGTLILLSGDVPLIRLQTLKALRDHHQATSARATVMTALVNRPHGYGRIVRNGQRIARIVEERDATPDERAIQEINAGIYAFALDGLFNSLRRISSLNALGEYYLPDLIALYVNEGLVVETFGVADADEIRGVNTRKELEEVSRIVRSRKNDALMESGVTLEDTATAYIDRDVEVGEDTIIHPGVSLEGRTTIGRGSEIHSGVRIVNSTLGDGVIVFNHSIIADSTVASGVRIGPFAHLRNHADLRQGARVGNFVEVKKTVLGAGSKSMHHAYLGDATIGRRVNIGAGTITCNYDGRRKYETVIEDDAFIGSDSQLVAPIKIGKGAYVGSGTTVRESVPGGALAVSAGKQRTIKGWAGKRRKK
jgi:bifunctional UDP-N-acetylglucosamine pyrophosphorylase/glucosamine-1-phosphate N-acetyltransferase